MTDKDKPFHLDPDAEQARLDIQAALDERFSGQPVYSGQMFGEWDDEDEDENE